MGGIAFFLFLSFVHAQGVNEKFKTPFTNYKVDNSTCTMITHPTGSKIFIQENAFGDGNQKIEIRYREFTSPLDMLVNEIPMTTTENGKTYQLASGGMFEIKAFNGDKELELLKDKKIEVQLAIANPSKKMNKMKAFKMPDSFDGWNIQSYEVKNHSVGNDDQLWGSSSISNFEEENEPLEGDWDDWGAEFDEEWRKQDSIRKVAFQAMEIDQMGFYNYDYKIEDVDFVSVVAHFSINQKATENTIYVVYDDLNTVFYYPKFTWRNDFKIIRGKSYKMFSIDKNGQIAYLNVKPNLNEIKDRSYTFNLVEEQKVPQSKEELASLLKL